MTPGFHVISRLGTTIKVFDNEDVALAFAEEREALVPGIRVERVIVSVRRVAVTRTERKSV